MSYFDLNWIEEYVNKQNPIIFDIGAHDFNDSVLFKTKYPESTVYAFEAFPYNIEKYSTNANNLGINIVNTAISDKIGTIKFFNSTSFNGIPWTCSGSILKPTKEEGVTIHTGLNYNKDGILVESTTIEKFCEENQIDNVDVIHMDIQGAEYYAIKGLGEKLKPKIIFCETCEYESYEESLTQKDLDDLLFNLGYEIKYRLIYDTLYLLK